MDTFTAFLIIIYAGIMHATFQLSVSVLTLLSSHTIGKTRSRRKLFNLTTSFVIGASIASLLLISFATLIAFDLFGTDADPFVWAVVAGLVGGVGISVWIFYYRRSKGTSLWIPRPVSDYLRGRTKDTSNSVEAFALGVMGILGEILFTIAPIAVAALTLSKLAPNLQIAGLFTYVIVTVLPLIIMWMLVGSGHKISKLQMWREKNKNFLQFTAGFGLLALGVYVYINEVITSAVAGGF